MFSNFTGAVGRAVGDGNQSEVPISLGQDRSDTFGKIVGNVVDGYDNGDGRKGGGTQV